jgi:hypothetical protein
LRVAVIAIGCLIGALVLGGLLLPEGEVATLSTFEADGVPQETAVWVVEGDGLGSAGGEVFLRTGPQTAWLARLRANPAVALERERDEKPLPYIAKIEEATEIRVRVNEAMAVKYGFADRVVAAFFDPEHSVPVRLVPDPTRATAEAHGAPH